MSASPNRFLKTIGAILYGLVAGFAATVVVVLGCIFLGFLVGWIFSFLGWRELGRSATMAGLYSINFTVPIGFIVGLIVCYTVSISRLRQLSGRPKPNSR
jgi:hypothetical protein